MDKLKELVLISQYGGDLPAYRNHNFVPAPERRYKGYYDNLKNDLHTFTPVSNDLYSIETLQLSLASYSKCVDP
jgi:hypothetical protein